MITAFRLFLVRLLTPAPTGSTKDVLAKIQTILSNDSTGKPDLVSTRRRQLADLILPDIMAVTSGEKVASVNLDGRQLEIDTTNAKFWAQACAQIIGLLAGIAVKPGMTGRALDEVFKTAKTIAGSMSNAQAAKRTELTTPGLGSTSTSPATPSTNKDASLKAREQMIADLETQSEVETTAEAKIALKNLADNMRKELELDKVA